MYVDARSSNGRTHGSGPCSEGSSPSRAVILLKGRSATKEETTRDKMKRVEFSPDDYIASQASDVRAALEELHTLIKTAFPNRDCCMWEGVFWGGSEQPIIGYGNYFYQRSDKKQVEWFTVGLARQKNYFSLYVNTVEGKEYLAEIYGPRLGKVKTGKSSISFRNLTDIDLDVLSEMIEHAGKITTETES